jgi:hypothetical protein
MSDEHCCDMMQHAMETDDIPVNDQARFRTWVIEQQAGLGTRWQISYCPWFSQELPADLSEDWLAEVQRRGSSR